MFHFGVIFPAKTQLTSWLITSRAAWVAYSRGGKQAIDTQAFVLSLSLDFSLLIFRLGQLYHLFEQALDTLKALTGLGPWIPTTALKAVDTH